MQRPEWFSAIVEWSALLIEFTGISVIVLGAIFVLVRYAIDTARHGSDSDSSYGCLRRRLGRVILLGLEFLVAADIVATVLIDPSLISVTTLGIIVLIRTFLSWSLEVELEGRWPWQSRPVGVNAKESA